MIEEVKDFFGDVKDKVGDKGFIVIILAIIVFFLFNLLKDSGSDEVYYTPTGVAGYPSLDKNADVVIDTLTQNMEGYYSEMLNVMQESNSDISGNINDSTTSILSALTDSESNILGSIGDSTSDIMGNISDSTTSVLDNIGESSDRITETVEGARDELTENMGLGFDSVHLGFETVENYIQEGLDKMNDLSSKIDNIDTTPRVEYVTQYVPVAGDTINNTVNVTDSIVGNLLNGSTADRVESSINIESAEDIETYEYKTKKGLNTETSFVDALKASGEDSSMQNRAKIAEANGIKNYTGTYSENVTLLKELKAGTLKKA